MEGYLKNKTTSWKHAFKRQVRPGGKIPLDDLYFLYGKKHSINEGKDFIDWLTTVKLSTSLNQWEIVLKSDVVEDIIEVKNIEDRLVRETDKVARNYSVEDVVLLSVRKARDILPNIMDLNLLKYAYKEANCLAGKGSLCRLLDKRVKELELCR